jgi:hypothetical protein
MNPKDKAKELVDKFDKVVNAYTNETLKQCALITVDVILNDIMLWWYAPTGDMPKDMVYFITQKNYWIEVKQEIEKL